MAAECIGAGDFNFKSLRHMKRCNYCGKEYDDTVTLCAIDREPVVAVSMVEVAASSRETQPSVEFIRLFFNSTKEEAFAVRCAQFIARSVGERIQLLRPDTTWSKIFSWFGPGFSEAAMFAFLLREEFGPEFEESIANAESMTFRDFVEYVCHQDRDENH